jgi:hypothetical protein
MDIHGIPTISASPVGSDKHKLTVNYQLTFTPVEVGAPLNTFRHGFKIWEMDVGTDQAITGWQGFNLDPDVTAVSVSKSIEVSNAALNTEPGDEEIRAEVLVRNLAGGPTKNKYSHILQLP